MKLSPAGDFFSIFVLKRKRILKNFRILKNLALICMGNFGIPQNTGSSFSPSSPHNYFSVLSVYLCLYKFWWGLSISVPQYLSRVAFYIRFSWNLFSMSSAFFSIKSQLGVELVIQSRENSLHESACCKHKKLNNFTASSESLYSVSLLFILITSWRARGWFHKILSFQPS